MAESVRYLMFLVGAYYFLQGMSGNPGLHQQALKAFLTKTQGFDASQLALFNFLITIPWMIKPVYGIIADMLPIRGYRMKGYFILGSALTALAYGLLAGGSATLFMLGVYLLIARIGIASSDVLCDRLMITKGKASGIVDLLQASQWFAISVAGVIVIFAGGYIAEYTSLPQAVLPSLLFAILVIPLTVFSWKEERVSSVGDAARSAWEGLSSACRSKTLWGCAAFLLFFNLSQKFESALFVYQTKELGFSQVLIGHIGTAGQIGFILGAALFLRVCKRFSREAMFRAIVFTAALTTFAYLFMKNPWSAFLVAIFTSLVGVVAFLGPLNLAAEACPKNAEGTVFALLMSLINISQSLSDYLGGLIYDRFGFSWLVLIFTGLAFSTLLFLPLVREKHLTKNA